MWVTSSLSELAMSSVLGQSAKTTRGHKQLVHLILHGSGGQGTRRFHSLEGSEAGADRIHAAITQALVCPGGGWWSLRL